MRKKRYLLLVIVIGFGLIFLFIFRNATAPTVHQSDTTAQIALIPESEPAQKDDLIVVESPRPQATVSSPLIIKGKARGNWYFEASFPVSLVDTYGTVLAEGHATAQGEWMTSEYVPFTATLTYTAASGTKAFLILKKDNPSGDAKFDNQLSIPITL